MENLIYKPDVYEGKDPYICVSFHPSDRERVMAVLEKLDYRGFRFWLNDGIPPGMDADEVIATHIENSDFFIAFMSDAYLGSLDMVDELNFSRDTNKDYLLVYLEDVALPYGLDMRFMRAQSIPAWSMTAEAVVSQIFSIDAASRFYGIADEKLRPTAERLFEKLGKLYPEHKVFALEAVSKQLSKSISELYIKAGYPSAERLMMDYGFTCISTEEARKLRSSVMYQPGFEPDTVKPRIDYIMSALTADFPDKTITTNLRKTHKSIHNSLMGLAGWLGYPSAAEMLVAYGFTGLLNADSGRTEVDHNRILALLEERYAERQKPSQISKLLADNPDLKASIKTMANRSLELFGTTLLHYLRLKGLIVPAEKQENSTKTSLNRAKILDRMQALYLESDGTYGTFEEVSGLESVVLKESSHGLVYTAGSTGCAGVLRLPLGIDYIAAESFAGQSDITQLILPPTLKEIREGAFMDCSGIESIVFSEGIERIGSNAFAGCTSLESVSFPASLKYIGSEAFAGCEELADAQFSNPRINIQEDAFDDCIFELESLQDDAASPAEYFELKVDRKNTAKILAYTGDEEVVVIPAMIGGHPIASIEKGCFKGNDTVREIYINDDISAINGDVFKDCVNLEKVHISNAVAKFTATTFAGCTSLAEVNIPDSMTDVPRGLFKDSPLHTIHIGKGVKSLSPDAFYKGTADFATGLYFKEKSLENLIIDDENEHFSNIGTMLLSKDGKLLMAELGDPAVAEIPEGVEEISAQAFEKICSFSQVRFPSTLKRIGEKAFAGTALTQVEFPDSLEHIGPQAFSYCRGLMAAEFNEGLKEIAAQAFEGCPIRQVYLPASVEVLGSNSFLAISAFPGQTPQAFRIDSANSHLLADGIALYTKTDTGMTLEKAYAAELKPLPNAEITATLDYTVKPGTTAIAAQAFARCSALGTIQLPEGLVSIGDMAFLDCRSLTQIHIPESCVSVSPKAFFGININMI